MTFKTTENIDLKWYREIAPPHLRRSFVFYEFGNAQKCNSGAKLHRNPYVLTSITGGEMIATSGPRLVTSSGWTDLPSVRSAQNSICFISPFNPAAIERKISACSTVKSPLTPNITRIVAAMFSGHFKPPAQRKRSGIHFGFDGRPFGLPD